MLYSTGYSSNNIDKSDKKTKEENKLKNRLEKDKANRLRRAANARKRQAEKLAKLKVEGPKRIDPQELRRQREREAERQAVRVKRQLDYVMEYNRDWCRSRGVKSRKGMLCERCRSREGTDIHHNRISYMGPRKHNKDGSDLILVCRQCHDELGASNDWETRSEVEKVIYKIIHKKNV